MAHVVSQGPFPSSTILPHKHTHTLLSFLLSPKHSLLPSPPPSSSPLWSLCAEEMEGLFETICPPLPLPPVTRAVIVIVAQVQCGTVVTYIYFSVLVECYWCWLQSYFLDVSSLWFSSRLSLCRTNLYLYLNDSNSHVPLLLASIYYIHLFILAVLESFTAPICPPFPRHPTLASFSPYPLPFFHPFSAPLFCPHEYFRCDVQILVSVQLIKPLSGWRKSKRESSLVSG